RALGRVGLSAHVDDYPHMLSGGEQQRVALARALVPTPSVLLKDEPFSNLDQRMRESIREETVLLLREQSATAVIVTHDPVEAMEVADRIILMRRGRLEQAGAPMDLYLHPESLYAARFLCDTNEIEGYCRGGRVECPLGAFPAAGVADGPAIVCVRPQSFSIVGPGEGIEAKIGGIRYLGDRIRVTVSLNGLSRLLHLTIPAHRTDLPEAGRIGLSVDESAVLVFPAASGSEATAGGAGE
ncbi:MAG: ABC transporter ATP-binding protein, partial [Hyphomicrobiaceae bacterium]